MKISGIYQIQSKIKPRRIYVGSAAYLKNRWYEHLKLLRKNNHHSIKLQNHFNKYGESDLIFIILEQCLPEFLIIREQYYIDTLNPFFNICQIAGSTLGFLHSIETKLILSEKAKTRKISDSTKKKISESLMGEKNHFFGKHHTKDSINKLSESAKKRPTDSDETRKKKSDSHKGKGIGANNPMFGVRRFGKDNPMYGKTCWRRGKKFPSISDEHRRKLSEAGKKRKHTEAELKIMSEAQKKAWIIRKQKKIA
jgi:group I intron endonuclease